MSTAWNVSLDLSDFDTNQMWLPSKVFKILSMQNYLDVLTMFQV